MLHTSVAGCQDSLIRAVKVASADLDGDDSGGFRDVGDTPVPVMHDGILVVRDAYSGPWMTEIIRRLHGHHEPQEELAFSRVLVVIATSEDAPTMIELGGWWAYYSLW